MFLAIRVAAQTALPPPRRTDCLQWDQAYGQVVLFGVIAVVGVAFVIAVAIVLLAYRFWPLTLARTRVWIGGTIALLLTEFVVVALPRVAPLGRGIFASIDARYPICQSMSFGAHGLLGGAIGKGVAAYAQWQAITLLVTGGAFVGALLAWIVCEWLLSTRGLKAMAQGSES
ncbi:MAG TPA: hypothetical protein VJZ00_15010 [Thermoanaerobaculia bacterium]|nr:hypothetical protein [Thermoanaerobaculia bacterium]